MMIYHFSQSWKALRWPLIGLWLLVTMTAMATFLEAADPTAAPFDHYVTSAPFLTGLLLIGTLAVWLLAAWKEAPSNPLGYGRTKPHDRGRLALCQWLFLLLTTVTPIALSSFVVPAAMDAPRAWWLALAFQTWFQLTLLLTVPFIACLYAHRLSQAIVITGLLLAPMLWFLSWGQIPRPIHAESFVKEAPYFATQTLESSLSRGFAAKLVLLLAVLVTLYRFHRSRIWLPTTLLGLVVLSAYLWPINLIASPSLGDRPPQVYLGWHSRQDRSSFTTPDHRRHFLSHHAGIRPLPANVTAMPYILHGTAQLDDGPLPRSTCRPASLTEAPRSLRNETEAIRPAQQAAIEGPSGTWCPKVRLPLAYSESMCGHGHAKQIGGAVETVLLRTECLARFPLTTRVWQTTNGVRFRTSQFRNSGILRADAQVLTVPEPWGWVRFAYLK